MIDWITDIASTGLCFFAAYTCHQVKTQSKQKNSLKYLEKLTEYYNNAAKILEDVPHDYAKWETAQMLIQLAMNLKSALMPQHLELYKCQLNLFRINLKNILYKIPTAGFFFFIPGADKLNFNDAQLKYNEMTNINNTWQGDLDFKLSITQYRKFSPQGVF